MVGKGVKQGSILSPSLFLLIMDPLLTRLQNSGLGLSLFAGGFIHADDIRALSSSTEFLENQISIVEIFSKGNLLKLNVQKCEIGTLGPLSRATSTL